jgi:hypothetical protein
LGQPERSPVAQSFFHGKGFFLLSMDGANTSPGYELSIAPTNRMDRFWLTTIELLCQSSRHLFRARP